MSARIPRSSPEAACEAVHAANERLEPMGLSLVVESQGLESTAHVLWRDADGSYIRVASRAGHGWRDAIDRAIAWAEGTKTP